MSQHTIYIGIGTNLPAVQKVLSWTHRKLAEAFGSDARFSTPEKTEPVDFPFPCTFTNQLAIIRTGVPLVIVRSLLKSIERQMGRKEEDVSKGIVKLDLDLLRTDDKVLRPNDWERDYIRRARQELQC